mgnify:FL=1
MNMKENDLVVISTVGINFIAKHNRPSNKIKSNKVFNVFKVTRVLDSECIYLETLDGKKIDTKLPIIYYRLATENEIKKSAIKQLFIKP